MIARTIETASRLTRETTRMIETTSRLTPTKVTRTIETTRATMVVIGKRKPLNVSPTQSLETGVTLVTTATMEETMTGETTTAEPGEDEVVDATIEEDEAVDAMIEEDEVVDAMIEEDEVVDVTIEVDEAVDAMTEEDEVGGECRAIVAGATMMKTWTTYSPQLDEVEEKTVGVDGCRTIIAGATMMKTWTKRVISFQLDEAEGEMVDASAAEGVVFTMTVTLDEEVGDSIVAVGVLLEDEEADMVEDLHPSVTA